MRVFYLLLSILCFSVTVLANQKEMLQLDSAFANGDYEKVELIALRILHSPDSLQNDDRARVNLTAGYAMILLGHEREARDYFKQALDAVPDLTLDPIQVSPKFKVIFDEVREAHQRKIEKIEANTLQQQSLRGEGFPSRKAMLFNLVVPGSGQMVQGHFLHGAVFTAAQVVSLVWFVKSLSDVHDSRKAYLSTSDAATISKAYDTYDRDHKTAWAAGIVTGVIYLASQADLILYRSHDQIPVQVSLAETKGIRLSVSW